MVVKVGSQIMCFVIYVVKQSKKRKKTHSEPDSAGMCILYKYCESWQPNYVFCNLCSKTNQTEKENTF